MFREFREFAMKGNLIDLSVAFVMGAAFTKLSTSFIQSLIMPFVGLVTAGADFTDLFIPLKPITPDITTLAAAKAKTIPVVAYGDFITVSINFVIVAFVMFLVVKAINKGKSPAAEEAVAVVPPTNEEILLTEIRDLLKSKQ